MPDPNDESRSRTYTGQLNSAPLTGRAEFFAAEDALEMSAGGTSVRLPYSAVQTLKHENFIVRAESDDGVYEFSRLGADEDWFYDEVLKALNFKVQKSFFETGAALVEIEARCLLTDETGQSGGRAVVRVFDESLLVLTPDRSARRLPLGFLKTLQKESYSVRMTFDSGENLTIFEAGFDLTPLLDTLDEVLYRLAKKRVSHLKTLLPSLPSSDITRLTSAYRMNTAIPVTEIPAALEQSMRNSFAGNMAVTYPRLKMFGDSGKLALGFAEAAEGDVPYAGTSAEESESAGREDASAFTGSADPEATSESSPDPEASSDSIPDPEASSDAFAVAEPSSDTSPYIFWTLLPSEDHRYAALELCLPDKAAAATYIFRTGGAFEDFLQLFNRAFEACRFRREFLTFTDAELLEEDAGAYKILIDRTPSLQRLRSLSAGRIIHSSPEAWEQKLRKVFAENGKKPTGEANSTASPAVTHFCPSCVSPTPPASTRFCPSCGCRISSSVRFCTECGKKL